VDGDVGPIASDPLDDGRGVVIAGRFECREEDRGWLGRVCHVQDRKGTSEGYLMPRVKGAMVSRHDGCWWFGLEPGFEKP